MREKYEITVTDHLTGLEIFAVQRKLIEYQQKFKEITTNDQIKVDQQVCEELGRTLQYFDNETEKQARLEMMEALQTKIMIEKIMLSSKLFDSLVYVYTESQQWSKVNVLLANSSLENCQPNNKTVGFLKKNLVYCFDPVLRGQLKENIDKFESTFFQSKPNTFQNSPNNKNRPPRKPKQQQQLAAE